MTLQVIYGMENKLKQHNRMPTHEPQRTDVRLKG